MHPVVNVSCVFASWLVNLIGTFFSRELVLPEFHPPRALHAGLGGNSQPNIAPVGPSGLAPGPVRRARFLLWRAEIADRIVRPEISQPGGTRRRHGQTSGGGPGLGSFGVRFRGTGWRHLAAATGQSRAAPVSGR